MSAVLRPVAVVLLVIGLTGCSTVAQPGLKSEPPAGTAVLAGEPGADLGNGRPAVTFDGLMVRRRVVVAIRPRESADLVSLRGQLDQAAHRLGLSLADISPTVLDADVLEELGPQLVVTLPEGGTVDDAGRLIDLTPSFGGAFPDAVQFQIGPVLVHDLRFAVRTADPRTLREAIEREGILADALGTYSSTTGTEELRIDYTGPLLSDDLIQSIRAGIAGPARSEPGDVSVSPRSTEGDGVQMESEPPPGSAPPLTPHGHTGG
ncbi:hypothetical protein [Cryobacterium cryoconiti]|uniref:Uncharacterized protein n=1 Tax=Cryobacterium cryoconiti TaxID=1259239 RepID=A0A4Y8JUL5_9MICO|nr:hypothetical protein [Cryobacterium cryoconiti]TFD29853.1 hypothetical protein E3T49_08820 [Cryobacterium cryoconiti]